MKTLFLHLTVMAIFALTAQHSVAGTASGNASYPYKCRTANGLYIFETQNDVFESPTDNDDILMGGIAVIGAKGMVPTISIRIFGSTKGVQELAYKARTAGGSIQNQAIRLTLANGEVLSTSKNDLYDNTNESARALMFGLIDIAISIEDISSDRHAMQTMSQQDIIDYIQQRLANHNIMKIETGGIVMKLSNPHTKDTFAAMFKDLGARTGQAFTDKKTDAAPSKRRETGTSLNHDKKNKTERKTALKAKELTVKQMTDKPFGIIPWTLSKQEARLLLKVKTDWPISYRHDGDTIETNGDIASDSQPYFLTYKNAVGHCQYIIHKLFCCCEYNFYTKSKDEAIMTAQSISRDLEAMGIKMYSISEKEIYNYISGKEKNKTEGKFYDHKLYQVRIRKQGKAYTIRLIITYNPSM